MYINLHLMTASWHDSIMLVFVIWGVPLVDLAECSLELLSPLGGHLGVDRRIILRHVLDVPGHRPCRPS